jgi:hypothetical protein
MLLQSGMFRRSMLRDRRSQPGPSKKRVSQRAIRPWLGQALIGVNVNELDLQSYVSGLMQRRHLLA